MNLSEITVKKKETNELVTRIFEDEEGIKEITSNDYIVEVKENVWIPVEERMPEKGKAVLVTYSGYRSGKRFSNATAYYLFGDWRWSVTNSIARVKIIAWMPLPEPYQGEEKQNETK